MVGPTELVKRTSLGEVIRVVGFGDIVLIDRHHVLEVIALGGVLGTLSYPTIIILLERLHVL